VIRHQKNQRELSTPRKPDEVNPPSPRQEFSIFGEKAAVSPGFAVLE
jgi:hypothetical protein